MKGHCKIAVSFDFVLLNDKNIMIQKGQMMQTKTFPMPHYSAKILSNSSPSIFSFSNKIPATVCNLSICVFRISAAVL